jgi:acetyl esterase/lipase
LNNGTLKMGPELSLMPALALADSRAAAVEPTLRFQVPATVSPEAAKELTAFFHVKARLPAASKPTSLEDWDRQREIFEKPGTAASAALANKLGACVDDDQIGGVPVLRVRLSGFKPNSRTLVFLHGGAYTRLGGRSRLIPPLLVAAATGDEVISVDYTLAPRGNWKTATDQMIAVWRTLLAEGATPATTGVFGDSAGGSLAAGSILKMRDLGLPLPGALYLMSPWSDITATGDTYLTLSGLDPSLDVESLSWSADAYADPKDQKIPYVSPVYGDYTKAFPPTLIQGGTREIFLSNFVRLYQVIRGGGREAVLDLYEGMPHVFQVLTPNSPETRTSISRAAAFFKLHLKSG